MAKNWTYIRVTRDTHAALQRVRESMRIAEEMGLAELETDDRDRVSLDHVIARLVEQYDRHAERRRRSAARRRRKSDNAVSQADTSIDPGGYPPDPHAAASPLPLG